jgi:hypothetical protein
MPREGAGGRALMRIIPEGVPGPRWGENRSGARRCSRDASNSETMIGRAYHVTSCRMRASRRGLDST